MPTMPKETPIKRAATNQFAMTARIMSNMETQECQHHWLIEAADGPVSRGICKLCQLVREFNNTVGVDKWGYFRLSKSDDDQRVE